MKARVKPGFFAGMLNRAMACPWGWLAYYEKRRNYAAVLLLYFSLNLDLAKWHPQVEYIITENYCQSPTFNLSKNFAKLSHPPHPMVSNATLMLTKSIYSVLLIYSVRPTTIRDHNAGSRGGLFPLSFKWKLIASLWVALWRSKYYRFDGSGAIIAYFVNKKDYFCKH